MREQNWNLLHMEWDLTRQMHLELFKAVEQEDILRETFGTLVGMRRLRDGEYKDLDSCSDKELAYERKRIDKAAVFRNRVTDPLGELEGVGGEEDEEKERVTGVSDKESKEAREVAVEEKGEPQVQEDEATEKEPAEEKGEAAGVQAAAAERQCRRGSSGILGTRSFPKDK
ncbi:hypothetical protein BTVI_50227 [Pitangus sulphuratus]|nr:hypothetical protein BTVI_50227 [Pitangus sulphuratus]